jgi:DnaK suppressor protein
MSVRTTVEQAADAPNTFTGVQGLLTDVLQDFGSRLHHGLGPIEHPLSGLRKGRNGADWLIELVGHATRHFLQRGHARDLHELLQQQRCALIGLTGRLVGSTQWKVPHGQSVHEAENPDTREFHGVTCARPLETACPLSAILQAGLSQREQTMSAAQPDLGQIKQLLSARRNALEERHRRVSRDLQRGNDPLIGDWSDRATQLQNDEVLQAIDDAARDELAAIDEALQRLDRGLYGTCKNCGAPIDPVVSTPCMPPPVLDAQPIDPLAFRMGYPTATRTTRQLSIIGSRVHNLHPLRSR